MKATTHGIKWLLALPVSTPLPLFYHCPLACFCGFDTIWADPAYGLSAASEQKWISVAADSEPREAGYMIAKT